MEALERGYTELAKSLLTVHISGVEQWLRQTLLPTRRLVPQACSSVLPVILFAGGALPNGA